MWRWSCPTFLPCNFLRWRKINENYARGWINDLWMCASLYISQSHTHTVSEANLYDLICSFTASLTKERFMLYQRRWKNVFESKHRAFLQLSHPVFGEKLHSILSRFENTGKICVALDSLCHDVLVTTAWLSWILWWNQVVTSIVNVIHRIVSECSLQNSNYELMRLCQRFPKSTKRELNETHTTNLIS